MAGVNLAHEFCSTSFSKGLQIPDSLAMRHPRSGIGLIELLAAMAILAVLLSFLVQMMSVAGQQRKLVEENRVVAEAVANLMERAMSLPFAEVQQSSLEELASARMQSPHYRWTVDVTATRRMLDEKRITIALRRESPNRQQGPRAKLVAWKYGPGSESAPDTPDDN